MKLLKGIAIVFLVLLLIVLIGPLVWPVPPLQGTRPAEELADPDSQFIDVQGVKIHYKEMGSGEPAVILLHGFAASTFSWREVMQPFSSLGRVIAYDRPGQGFTARPMEGEWQGANPYSSDTQPELLIGLMDQLGVQEAILVGNSAGGTAAALTALEYPDRVRALVLVDPAIYTSGPQYPGIVRAILHSPQADRLGPLFVRSIERRGMELLTLAWHDTSRIPPEVFEGYRKPLQVSDWDKGLWELTRSPREKEVAPRLNELSLPVLVITGDDDCIVPTADSIRLAGELPQAQLAVMPACGHTPQEECPQEFLSAAVPFIQQHK